MAGSNLWLGRFEPAELLANTQYHSLINRLLKFNGSWRIAQGSWLMPAGSRLMAHGQENLALGPPGPGPSAKVYEWTITLKVSKFINAKFSNRLGFRNHILFPTSRFQNFKCSNIPNVRAVIKNLDISNISKIWNASFLMLFNVCYIREKGSFKQNVGGVSWIIWIMLLGDTSNNP